MAVRVIALLLLVSLGYSQGIFSHDKPDGIYATKSELKAGKPSGNGEGYILENDEPFQDFPTGHFYNLYRGNKKYSGFTYVYKRGNQFYINTGGFFSELQVYDTHSWSWGVKTVNTALPGNPAANMSKHKQCIVLFDNATGKGKDMNDTHVRKLLRSNQELYKEYENDPDRKEKDLEYIDAFCSGENSLKLDKKKSVQKELSHMPPEPGSVTFTLKNGKVHTGFITNETPVMYNMKVNGNNLTLYKTSVVKRVEN